MIVGAITAGFTVKVAHCWSPFRQRLKPHTNSCRRIVQSSPEFSVSVQSLVASREIRSAQLPLVTQRAVPLAATVKLTFARRLPSGSWVGGDGQRHRRGLTVNVAALLVAVPTVFETAHV